MVKLKIYDDIDMRNASNEGFWKGYLSGGLTLFVIGILTLAFVYGGHAIR